MNRSHGQRGIAERKRKSLLTLPSPLRGERMKVRGRSGVQGLATRNDNYLVLALARST